MATSGREHAGGVHPIPRSSTLNPPPPSTSKRDRCTEHAITRHMAAGAHSVQLHPHAAALHACARDMPRCRGPLPRGTAPRACVCVDHRHALVNQHAHAQEMVPKEVTLAASLRCRWQLMPRCIICFCRTANDVKRSTQSLTPCPPPPLCESNALVRCCFCSFWDHVILCPV